MRLLNCWGFRYVTGGSWFKRTKHGKANFGPGYVLRTACEPFLIGALGSPMTAKNVRNAFETLDDTGLYAENRGHSRKPDDQYAMCEAMAPRALRFVELFARQRWQGGDRHWDAWGNQLDRFEAEPRLEREGDYV